MEWPSRRRENIRTPSTFREAPISRTTLILAGQLQKLKGSGRINASRIVLCAQNYEARLEEFMEDELGRSYRLTEKKMIIEKGRKRHLIIYDKITVYVGESPTPIIMKIQVLRPRFS